jgi:hypothetical protein
MTNVSIGAGVTNIGNVAFAPCTRLGGITVDALNPSYASVEGVLFDKSRTTLIQYPGGKSGGYTIPNGVTRIRRCAFMDCINLTSIRIAHTVTEIEQGAFSVCLRLVGAYFEGHAPVIEPYSLQNCSALIVYYRPGTTGWGPTFAGRPTALWIDPPAYSNWVQSTALPTQYPNASAESDDPDQDGMSNYAEMLAGTSPTDPASLLALECVPRPDDLSAADKTPIGVNQQALYFRSVPGKSYGVQSAESLDGHWNTKTVVTATTTQKRLVLAKPETQAFYRVILAQ